MFVHPGLAQEFFAISEFGCCRGVAFGLVWCVILVPCGSLLENCQVGVTRLAVIASVGCDGVRKYVWFVISTVFQSVFRAFQTIAWWSCYSDLGCVYGVRAVVDHNRDQHSHSYILMSRFSPSIVVKWLSLVCCARDACEAVRYALASIAWLVGCSPIGSMEYALLRGMHFIRLVVWSGGGILRASFTCVVS